MAEVDLVKFGQRSAEKAKGGMITKRGHIEDDTYTCDLASCVFQVGEGDKAPRLVGDDVQGQAFFKIGFMIMSGEKSLDKYKNKLIYPFTKDILFNDEKLEGVKSNVGRAADVIESIGSYMDADTARETLLLDDDGKCDPTEYPKGYLQYFKDVAEKLNKAQVTGIKVAAVTSKSAKGEYQNFNIRYKRSGDEVDVPAAPSREPGEDDGVDEDLAASEAQGADKLAADEHGEEVGSNGSIDFKSLPLDTVVEVKSGNSWVKRSFQGQRDVDKQIKTSVPGKPKGAYIMVQPGDVRIPVS